MCSWETKLQNPLGSPPNRSDNILSIVLRYQASSSLGTLLSKGDDHPCAPLSPQIHTPDLNTSHDTSFLHTSLVLQAAHHGRKLIKKKKKPMVYLSLYFPQVLQTPQCKEYTQSPVAHASCTEQKHRTDHYKALWSICSLDYDTLMRDIMRWEYSHQNFLWQG